MREIRDEHCDLIASRIGLLHGLIRETNAGSEIMNVLYDNYVQYDNYVHVMCTCTNCTCLCDLGFILPGLCVCSNVVHLQYARTSNMYA